MQTANANITVNDVYQRGYQYEITCAPGQEFDPEFTPDLTPAQMLKMGVFSGKYFSDRPLEFPPEWFEGVGLAGVGNPPNDSINYFGVGASQPLSVWLEKGWINPDDPRGWFQWYCRYYQGRRHNDDQRQIKRWRAMRRHIAQVKNNCHPGDLDCRKKQRQALLHWAYDSRKI